MQVEAGPDGTHVRKTRLDITKFWRLRCDYEILQVLPKGLRPVLGQGSRTCCVQVWLEHADWHMQGETSSPHLALQTLKKARQVLLQYQSLHTLYL